MWLGPQRDHYYVLSRFLISRMLTVTKVPPLKAVKIALELKKLLVDSERLEILQVGLMPQEAGSCGVLPSHGQLKVAPCGSQSSGVRVE